MTAMKLGYGFRIKPGRFEDWRALTQEGAKLVERLGARSLQAYGPVAAGPESAICYATIDFDSGASWGAFQDAVANDAESQAFNERMSVRPDSPIEVVSVILLNEILLGVGNGTPGPVLESFASRVQKGRFDDAVVFATETAPLALRTGATAVHFYAVAPGGSDVGTVVWTTEFPSFTAYGRHLDDLGAPEIREAMQRLAAPDSPLEVTQHGVYAQLPL
jgi:hypothetical protein